ncbi:MAG: metallophosphoesterase family protein [Gammaproteobacteria bacterium]|nr:metallophosphoesterase family protein [Gammaproteobacteria bacterium]
MCKRIPRATLVFVTSLVLIFGGVFPAPAMAELERQPYLQSISDTRVVMRWRTTSGDSSRVSYGSSVGNLNTDVDMPGLRTEHEVVITGLAANTKYFYSVGSVSGSIEAGNDAGHYFITAPDVGSSRKIRIWAIGDAGTGKTTQDDVRDAYYNLDDVETDVVLALGDNAYSDGTESDYTNNFFNVYNGLLKHAPVWSTRGNHDRDPGIYETAFTHPTQAEGGGIASGSELYYSFDYGNIHFVCLDSFTDSNLKGTAMYTWLENDLASTLQKWIIAYWHHPPYSRSSAHDSDSESGQRLSREMANPILESYGVDLQLGGHNHFYSRTVLINNHYGLSDTWDADIHAIDPGDGRGNGDGVYRKESNPEGAVYVLAGSSGKIDYTPIHHPANFIEDEVLGSMVIDVEGDRMDVRMLRENGTVQDYFSITKAPQANQAPRVNAGNNQSAETGVAINLDATVNDDGLPAGVLTYDWIKVSGPGTAAFANGAAVDTPVSFSAAGSYTLQLAASDGVLSASDQIIITVTDPDDPGSVIVAAPGASGNVKKSSSAGSVDATLLLGFLLLALLRRHVRARVVYIVTPGRNRDHP